MKPTKTSVATAISLTLCLSTVASCAPSRREDSRERSHYSTRDLPASDEAALDELRDLRADVTVEKNQLGSLVVSVDLTLVQDVTAALRLVALLPRVDRLSLLDADLDASNFEQLQQLKTLRWLDLSNTAVTDDQLEFLSSVPQLEFLLLWGTSISDQGLPHIAKLSRLQKLDLSATKITSSGLAHLAELHELLELYVEAPGIDEVKLKQLQAQLPNTLIVH